MKGRDITRHAPQLHATRSTPLATYRQTSGVRSCVDPPRWLLLATNAPSRLSPGGCVGPCPSGRGFANLSAGGEKVSKGMQQSVSRGILQGGFGHTCEHLAIARRRVNIPIESTKFGTSNNNLDSFP